MLRSILYSLHQFGLVWMIKRLWVEFCIRVGFYRMKFPLRYWRPDEYRYWLSSEYSDDSKELFQQWLKEGPKHFVPDNDRDYKRFLTQFVGDEGISSIKTEAEAIRRGRFRYFFKKEGNLGFPPDWHLNPFTGGRTSSRDHWTRIPVQSPIFGDIKYIWEPGRFASAYVLARAYSATGDEEYAECFWQIVESWGKANSPNHGAHWRCGQEISIRLLAWAFGLYVFRDTKSTTPERFATLLGMIAAQADRVAGTTLYSHLQDNNHSISEGTVLWTVGILFPMLAKASIWRKKGKEILEGEAKRLIYEDGSFSQKSNNYHRLMLHDYLYAIRIGEVNGYKLDGKALVRIRRAANFLLAMTDPISGWAPNIGGNDGALILPLNSCDYNDMRAVVAAAHYLFTHERLFELGSWHEDLYWFFGPYALNTATCNPDYEELDASSGGYYTLRGRESWGMLRCGNYVDRPSHSDSLHFDLWWRGRNIALDPGSYLYYGEPPWNNGLQSTRFHNTVCVDSLDQLEKGPRFMWFKWHNARLFCLKKGSRISCLEGEHDGYKRLENPVWHRRCVMALRDIAWIIIDDLYGEGVHEFDLNWLIGRAKKVNSGVFDKLLYPEGPVWFLSRLLEPEQVEQESAEWLKAPTKSDPRGWYSRYYGFREPAFSFKHSIRCKTPVRFFTVFSFSKWKNIRSLPQQVTLEQDDKKLNIQLNKPETPEGIFNKVSFSDSFGEEILNHC